MQILITTVLVNKKRRAISCPVVEMQNAVTRVR